MAMKRAEVRQALVKLWAQIFLAEIQEMQAATVGTPGGLDHG